MAKRLTFYILVGLALGLVTGLKLNPFIALLLSSLALGAMVVAAGGATVVSTGVLKPQTAVAMAALFNFVAIFVFHQLTVAATVGKGTIDPGVVDQYVIFGALVGAVTWNVITWLYLYRVVQVRLGREREVRVVRHLDQVLFS